MDEVSWLLSEARHVRFDDPAEEARFVRQIWWENESFFEDVFSLATSKTGSKADNFAWIFWDSFRSFSSLESFWLVEVRNIHPVTGGLVEIWNQHESTNRRFVCKH